MRLDDSKSPKVFISYSWTSEEHVAWVLDLAEKLVDDGVDVILDRWDLKPGQDKYHFMEQMVKDETVTKVLIVCDKAYADKADRRAGGVGTETQIISRDGEPAVKLREGVSWFAKGPERGLGFARALGAIVLDPRSYRSPGRSVKSCYFVPTVAFRVCDRSQFVDVVVCLGCSQLAVLENDPKVPVRRIRGSLEGRFLVAGDFEALRPALLALAKRALPGDRAIQELR